MNNESQINLIHYLNEKKHGYEITIGGVAANCSYVIELAYSYLPVYPRLPFGNWDECS